MDYYEQQQRLLFSPVMYREKDTVYLFSQNDRKKYILNKMGVYEQWEDDFKYLLILL